MQLSCLQVGVITLFPEVMHVLDCSITGRAIKKGLVNIRCWQPRDYSDDKHRCVDDRPYGGGPGMVMDVQPLRDTITAAKQALGEATKVIYLSPKGKRLDQATVKDLASLDSFILLAGHYEGIDERVIENHVDEELSLGDFVLTGGEIAALAVIDAVTRLLPGALGHELSAEQDSFANGLLDCPHYTRPDCIDGRTVPEVLLSGDHKAIEQWRLKQMLGKTWQRRPDLLEKKVLNEQEKHLLTEYITAYKEQNHE